MTDRFRLTIAQLNATLGDLAGNAARAREAWARGRDAGAGMVALPEMFLSGYQAQDLAMKPAFVADCQSHLARLAEDCAEGPALGIGAPMVEGGMLYNCYFVLEAGRVLAVMRKHHLPNYTVFDEKRVFSTGPISGPYRLAGGGPRIGTPICEDAWFPDVTEAQAESGAEILLVPNGSPYFRGKFDIRLNQMVARVTETGLPLVYLNLMGGQDDQVFDGGSFVLNRHGALAGRLKVFEEDIRHVDFMRDPEGWHAGPSGEAPFPDSLEQDWHAMVLSLRDYLRKTGFTKVLLGLSGGIDSAAVAAVAVDALGPENVRCVMLPSEYTSPESLDDARAVARNLGVRLDTVPISGVRGAATDALAELFAGYAEDITEENLQSRIRGMLLMAQSNKFGEMLLTTGNKSEVAVGYATIYGDMSGGFNPIKDLYKTRVFAICRWRNGCHRPWMLGPPGEVIPPRVIDKPPSAELKPDQKDEDSLPPYEELDAILEMLVDREASVADCVAAGHDPAIVEKVENLLYVSEYKRFQAAPGTRLSMRAFWLDRRYPIVNRWRDPG